MNIISKMHRLQTNIRGRPKAKYPIRGNQHHALGGIPMTIRNGKIRYKQIVPHNYGVNKDGEFEDEESLERERAVLPIGVGNFIRRHIYELRYDIKTHENDQERRKREYEEWWNKQNV